MLVKQNVNLGTKVKILLEGELVSLSKKQIDSWFDESLKYAVENEKYLLAAKLRDAKIRWSNQLKNKSNDKL